MENMKNKGWTWLCHHEVLLEFCDDYKGRVAYIRREKPACEVPVRLKWFRFVKCKLPPEVVRAWAAYDKALAAYGKAWAAYGKAWAAYDKAWAAYKKAIADHMPEIEALYRNECPGSPWNGRTLFPK